VFAPLANRLGIWPLKWELEDLAFRFTEPQTYRDIARLLGTTDFGRVRVGIGRPEGRMPPADYVLGRFSTAEEEALPAVLELACQGAEAMAIEGLLAAQQRIHPLS
jgi:peptidyl-tRNA hydrolase